MRVSTGFAREIPDVPAWPTARIAAYAPGQNRPYLLDCSFDLALRLRYALGGERRASTNEGAVEHRSAAAGSAEATLAASSPSHRAHARREGGARFLRIREEGHC